MVTEVASTGGGALGEHRTVTRVMTILEHVLSSEPNGLRLADLSELMDAPKSSIHGLCRGLIAMGYLREQSGRYLIGPAVSMLLAAGQAAMPAAYRTAMEALTKRWGETTVLVTLVGEHLVYLAKEEPDTMVRASPPMNTRLPLWPRSSGKVFLAYMSEVKREKLLKKYFKDADERERVRAVLEEIREKEITSRSASGEAGIAVPVIFPNRPVTTSLSVVGPAERMDEKRDSIAVDLLETVQKLSKGSGLELE